MLFVIDNSGTMGEEQLNLSANFPLLIQKLQALQDSDGMALEMLRRRHSGVPFQVVSTSRQWGSSQGKSCSMDSIAAWTSQSTTAVPLGRTERGDGWGAAAVTPAAARASCGRAP